MLSCLPFFVSFLFADGDEEEMDWEFILPPLPVFVILLQETARTRWCG